MPEGVAVIEDLFGVRGKVGALPIGGEAAIEFVVGGENILDFRTQLCFLERESIEQNGGIRDAVGAAFQFGQGTAGASGGFEDTGSLQFGLGREIGELIKRFVWAEMHTV